MVDSIKGSFEHSGWDGVFDMLDTIGKESLARQMAVAGGRVIRDAAALNAMEIPPNSFYGDQRRYLLSRSIYVAFNDRNTSKNEYTYNVSWNHAKAKHGWLVEFGHWQPYKVYVGSDGQWYTNLKAPLAQPKWVPGYPFLRPAFDNNRQRAFDAMIIAGREALAEIMKGNVE